MSIEAAKNQSGHDDMDPAPATRPLQDSIDDIGSGDSTRNPDDEVTFVQECRPTPSSKGKKKDVSKVRGRSR